MGLPTALWWRTRLQTVLFDAEEAGSAGCPFLSGREGVGCTMLTGGGGGKEGMGCNGFGRPLDDLWMT